VETLNHPCAGHVKAQLDLPISSIALGIMFPKREFGYCLTMWDTAYNRIEKDMKVPIHPDRNEQIRFIAPKV